MKIDLDMNEFNLSEKRGEWNCKTGWEPTESLGGAAKFYKEEDVKEFIRLLKEKYTIWFEGKGSFGTEIIDKLAGEKLI